MNSIKFTLALILIAVGFLACCGYAAATGAVNAVNRKGKRNGHSN